VVHNWSWAPVRVNPPPDMTDVLANGGNPISDLELGPWDVRVVAG
jgi:hypothetical protein